MSDSKTKSKRKAAAAAATAAVRAEETEDGDTQADSKRHKAEQMKCGSCGQVGTRSYFDRMYLYTCTGDTRYCRDCLQTQKLLKCEGCHVLYSAGGRFLRLSQPWNDDEKSCDACHEWKEAKRDAEYKEMKQTIVKVWTEFCASDKRYKHSTLIDSGDAKTWDALVHHLKIFTTPVDWIETFWGTHPSALIPAQLKGKRLYFNTSQAADLFALYPMVMGANSTCKYKYDHALANHVLLIKDIHERKLGHEGIGYYRSARTKAEIIAGWTTHTDFLWNVGKFALGHCAICADKIVCSPSRTGNGEYVQCGTCCGYTHFTCKMKAMKKTGKLQCELCRAVYMNPGDLLTEGTVARAYKTEDGSLVQLNWIEGLAMTNEFE